MECETAKPMNKVPLTAKKSLPSQCTIHTTATKDQTDRRVKKAQGSNTNAKQSFYNPPATSEL